MSHVTSTTPRSSRHRAHHEDADRSSWRALFALVVGFFMILVDSTIVTVAMPGIITGLHTDLTSAVWVTSAYLLAYAVPLLITGRLGDRFGPKRMYLLGLVVFTLASLWCGLSGTVSQLITARVVQGLGASLMTPQTMAVITRLFPARQRAQAMSIWGSTAGIALLVGPLLGGLLTDSFGWEWIFFVNVPVGVAGFALAALMVPTLEVHSHRFDWLGVLLSALGMFLIVFGLQEGHTYHWSRITSDLTVGSWHTGVPVSVWGLMVVGALVMAVFVAWQSLNRAEPLVPLTLFLDRNFSLANVCACAMGCAVTSMGFPQMLFLQESKGLSPVRAALVMIPLAVAAGAFSPVIGRLTSRHDPKWYAVAGFLGYGVTLALTAWLTHRNAPVWLFLVTMFLTGATTSCIWGPMGVTATRNLPPDKAGAGSGVYNVTRQMGAVLGSAAIASLMDSRLSAEFAAAGVRVRGGAGEGGFSGRLPAALREPFGRAMGTSMLLPTAAALLGLVAALAFARTDMSVHQPSPTTHAE